MADAPLIAAVLAALRSAGAMLLFFVVGGSIAAGEQSYSFDRAAGGLPKSIVPVHYAIELEPNLENLALAGSERVDIEVREATDRIVLNAAGLTIIAASIDGWGQPARIALDEASETATLTYAQHLAPGTYKLRLAFTAQISKYARGLFTVDYQAEGVSRQLVSTHLKPANARRVFPCWDEPAFKASFTLSLTIPRSFAAISNMPVVHEEPVSPTVKQVRFAATPKMSSYLFLLTAGEFERLSTQSNGITLSVVTVPGKREQGRFALASAAQLLRYFNDYFRVKYPLPKLDLIALPGGFTGALEHWGGITFFESRLLFDAASSAPAAQRGIFLTLAHEIARQWLGNLVTMAQWDSLWLNEGLAAWMAAKAADHFYPQWRPWHYRNSEKEAAMELDARRTSQPLQRPVTDESEAGTPFDAHTHAKGASLTQMLETYLGEASFRAAIRQYVTAHAYANTTSADLWKALDTASRRPLGALVSSFTEQAGVPLIAARVTCVGSEQRVELRQKRFTVHDPHPGPQRWHVPVVLGPIRALPATKTVLLNDTATIVAGRCGEPIKINFGNTGYYRAEYDASNQAALVRALPLMAAADRANLVSDAWALVEAGQSGLPAYFELLEHLGNDDDRAVWDEIIRIFMRLNHLLCGHAERAALRRYARAKLRAPFDRLGWEAAVRDNEESASLRGQLIRTLGEFDDAEIVAEARRRFARFLQNPSALRPSLRDAVVHVVGVSADRNDHTALLALARTARHAADQERYLRAAASARDPALARETLERTLTDEVPIALKPGIIRAVALTGEQPQLAWQFVQQSFAALAVALGPSFADAFVPHLMSNFSDREHASEFADFASAHASPGGAALAARAKEAILINAELRARLLLEIEPAVPVREKRY
jgi:aminopeptidase N